MISSRYGHIVALFLGIAMVPAIVHGYLAAKSHDGYKAGLISKELAGVRFVRTKRYDAWAKQAFAAEDWIERNSETPRDLQVRLFVGRSYDHKRLYHHPELAILYGKDLENAGVRSAQTRNDIQIHFLVGSGGKGISAYCLLYDGEFVENPIIFQFLTSLKLLFSMGKPMTLFFVHDPSLSSTSGFERTIAGRVLFAAIEDFQSQGK